MYPWFAQSLGKFQDIRHWRTLSLRIEAAAAAAAAEEGEWQTSYELKRGSSGDTWYVWIMNNGYIIH